MESTVVKNIIKYLNSLDNCRAIKTSGDAKRAGEPDIDCVYCGQSIKLEVKRPGNNRVTKLQQAMLQKWADAGAVVGVVHSVDEVKELFQEKLKGGNI
ncbi:VRR-NUC domain-containing protein [Thermosyntropha sp.]|uniref:VRR-NUC domain-containing protein n=1 Tax=Thermosyntropha sp. TaxID=2740820 RepID=UPI0025D77D9C|nr:VRR-NUC domain-containing protein [Thermosyntropha sp.]MBO8158844.1 VRR-NUC domain-containing protein [Thermosyntropha sp.]